MERWIPDTFTVRTLAPAEPSIPWAVQCGVPAISTPHSRKYANTSDRFPQIGRIETVASLKASRLVTTNSTGNEMIRDELESSAGQKKAP